MSVLKLLSVEYDSKTNELRGGMIDRLYEILSEEEKKKVVDALEIVSEAFIEDIEVEPISKVKSYQPIKEERDLPKEYLDKIEKLGILAKSLEIDKNDFMYSCLKDLPMISEMLKIEEREAFTFLKESVDEMFK